MDAKRLRRVKHEVGNGQASIRAAMRGHEFSFAARLVATVSVNVAQLVLGSATARRRCSCCGWQGVGFLWSANEVRTAKDAICPQCGSRSRHRALQLLVPLVTRPELVDEVLHFAPEPQLLPALRRLFPDARYRTTDLNRGDVDLPGLDIQHLELPDDSFDLILCNHVLEHVVEDEAAIQELARVARPSGTVIITVPGEWGRQEIVSYAEADPNGHWRDYGNDVAGLFSRSFGKVSLHQGTDVSSGDPSFGVRAKEPIFVCREPVAPTL